MAYTTIDDPTDYFNTKLYSGNASTQSITGVGFQPDMCWFKVRNNTDTHAIFDAVRGATKRLIPDNTSAEGTQSNGLTSFDSDGFTSGDANITNGSSRNYASWNWKAGTSFTNDASATSIGTIDSSGSVNETAGFSIISYTGTGANGSIKHGLSTAPRAMIFKNRDEGAEGWFVYHESVGNTKRAGLLDSTSTPSTSSTFFQDTSPTSSIITLGSNHGCNGPDAMICYAFAEKKGYSKFGSYVANGDVSGGFVYTGFKIGWLMIKRTDSAAGWIIYDSKREGRNTENNYLLASSSSGEGTNNEIDLYSNGFKPREANRNELNVSGGTYIFMAFAESPFVSSTGIPTTAR